LSRRICARATAAAIALLCVYLPAFADPRAKPDASAANTDGAPLSAETQAALRDALMFDPSLWMNAKPVSPRTSSQKNSGHDLDWNRTDKVDGSSAVTVKKPLPLEWDAKIGADIGLAPTFDSSYQPDKSPLLTKGQNSGATWASIMVPGGASIDARLDPSKDQSKLGTTLSRSVPFGGAYSVTLQNTFAVTETLGSAPNAPPAAGSTQPGAPAQVWSNDRLVKFNFLSTGTTIAAGTSNSNAYSSTRSKFSAEQKLFDGLNITTSVTDVGAPTASKSITAGYKWKW
jgi:hypothetical protein